MCVEHDDDESTIRVRVSNSLTAHLLDVVSRVRRLFDVDAEPLVIAKHLAVDPVLEASLQRAPGLRVPGAFDHFETAVWAVLGQHVSFEVVSELEERIIEKYGESIETIHSELSRIFPTPHALSRARLEAVGVPKIRSLESRDRFHG